MFPINLQKNIDQLGKQISLLENECKNLEMEKKKRGLKSQPSLACKPSDIRVKPTFKVPMKKHNSFRKAKSTPPISERLQSATHPSSKPWSESGGSVVKGKDSNAPVGSSQALDSTETATKKEDVYSKSDCDDPSSVQEFDRGDCLDLGQSKGELLHKELRFPHPGGLIEVTVTQKTNLVKDNRSAKGKSPKKGVSLENRAEKEMEFCKCKAKGQKWADILSSDNFKKRQTNSGTNVKNKTSEESKINYQPLNLNNHKMLVPFDYYGNVKPNQQKEPQKLCVELLLQSNKTKEQLEFNACTLERETQRSFKEPPCKDPVKGPNPINSLNAFNIFCDQILHGSIEEQHTATVNSDTGGVKKRSEPQAEPTAVTKSSSDLRTFTQNGTSSKSSMKAEYENLKKEKEILSQELAAKDSMIAALKKREDDYLMLITDLKTHLEKVRGNAQERTDAMRETNFFKTKLLQQIKLSEALKQNHVRMQEIIERYTLENDKLKTRVKIFKLETQKHEVLLAGKEAQINKYREEILNFQRQISDHLASLKTNAQEVNVEKMMEAIFQQTQLFTKLEEDSILENDAKDNSDAQNALMHSTPHSSPGSTKNSIVNSSWKRISSIHGHDLSRANSDFVVYLNDDKRRKNFFEVFKEKPISEPLSAKRSKEGSLEEELIEKDVKQSSSFTSCLTGQEGQVSSHQSLTSKESTISGDEMLHEPMKMEKRTSSQVAQSNIEKLLKSMKLKFSKEILETSLPSCSTEDFPDISQISSMSPVH